MKRQEEGQGILGKRHSMIWVSFAPIQIHEGRTCKFLSGREILAQRAVWGKAQSREKKKRCTRTTDKGTRESGQGGRKAEGLGAAQDRTV